MRKRKEFGQKAKQSRSHAFIPPVIILFRPILVAQCCKTSIPILDKLTLDLAFRKSEMKFCNPLAWVDIFYNVQIQEQCLQYWVYCCWGLILWPKTTGTEVVVSVLLWVTFCVTVKPVIDPLRRAVTRKCLQRVGLGIGSKMPFIVKTAVLGKIVQRKNNNIGH